MSKSDPQHPVDWMKQNNGESHGWHLGTIFNQKHEEKESRTVDGSEIPSPTTWEI